MRDLGRLLELVVRNSAPLPSVAEIFFYTLPTTFTITLPMGVLVGILIGLSRLAADSEVTAIRASGMGAGMFVRVLAIFAVAAWGLGMLNSIYVAPRSAAALEQPAGSLEVLAGLLRDSASRLLRRVQEQRSLRAGRSPLKRPVVVARHISGGHHRPCVSQNHSSRARRPAQRISRQGSLPSRRRHPAGNGRQDERPVLHYHLRQHRHSDRTALQPPIMVLATCCLYRSWAFMAFCRMQGANASLAPPS